LINKPISRRELRGQFLIILGVYIPTFVKKVTRGFYARHSFFIVEVNLSQ